MNTLLATAGVTDRLVAVWEFKDPLPGQRRAQQPHRGPI